MVWVEVCDGMGTLNGLAHFLFPRHSGKWILQKRLVSISYLDTLKAGLVLT